MSTRLRTAVVALLVLTAMAAPPALAASDESTGPDIAQSSPDGTLVNEWVVEFEAGGYSDLASWADESSDRAIQSVDNGTRSAVVAAPEADVRLSGWTLFGQDITWGDGLEDAGYVTAIHPNYRLSYVDPVDTLQNESAFDVPAEYTFRGYGFGGPAYSTTGIAFREDANQTTPAETRAILGGDNLSTSVDGDGVRIAVVDTGWNPPASPGTILGNGTAGSEMRLLNASKNFIANTTVAGQGYDALNTTNLHGPWVTSAIAADYNGTQWDGAAPNASVLALKALKDDGSGETATIARAIRYAADHEADVISLSVGSPIRAQPIVDAINYATANGSIVVAAAGNSRMLRSPGVATPADVPGVVTVGATNASVAKTASSAFFSQYSGRQATDGNLTNTEEIDVVSPGMSMTVKVSSADGYTSNHTLSGTSMSTPWVAGYIGAVLETRGDLVGDPTGTVEAAQKSARPVPHITEAAAGHGMFAADNLATETHPETSQADAMTDAATARDTYYDGLAADAGGIFGNILGMTTTAVGA